MNRGSQGRKRNALTTDRADDPSSPRDPWWNCSRLGDWQGFVTLEGVAPMFLARVTGSVVATQKVASMTGQKLLVVEPYRLDDKGRDRLVPTGRTFVVVDTLGAGLGEMVLICQGSSARLTPETDKLPIDAVVIGLVDTVDIGGRAIFSTHGATT